MAVRTIAADKGCPVSPVSEREFSDDPSGRYAALVARGLIRLKAVTTSDLDSVPQYRMPGEIDPLDALLAERAEDDR
jgi:hypothetical protein